MREFARLSLRLMIICVVAAAALGGTNLLTKDRIKERQNETAYEALRELFADADDFVELNAEAYSQTEAYENVTMLYAAVKGDDLLGYAVGVTEKGYKGGIDMTVGVTPEGGVLGVRIGANEETPGLGAKIVRADFYGQFDGWGESEVAVNKDGGGVHEIAGATISSRAVSHGTDTARLLVQENAKSLQGQLEKGGSTA